MEKYKFKKYEISAASTTQKNKIYDYGVDYESLDNENKPLFKINSHLWSSEKIQKLLDNCLLIKGKQSIEYEIEGSSLGIVIFKDEVYFFDLRNENEYEDMKWSHEKFVNFLKDFKVFLLKNNR